MRRGFEHGFHGLHGYFLGTWIFLGVPWCVGILNTDCTDYTDVFYWRGVKTGGFGPIVRKHKIIREIRVIRVQ